MANRPTGTITLFFTDIEGSTTHWERDKEGMQTALARHDAIVRHAVEAHGGYIFKTLGDGFCAAFATALDALVAALHAQRALHTEHWSRYGPLRVRMALHTGAAQERDGDYFGPPLNRVARLLTVGHGGQTLLSQACQELVRDELPPGVKLRDLGEHRLKDLTRPERIFQLVTPDLPADFPPLTTLDAHPNNLPVQPTPLIGREHEVATICQRLLRPDVRLLTLTGPGGTGKTRLGLQVAVELLDAFADGVFFVSLVPIRDPALVVSTIAQTLDIKETGNQPLFESLKTHLHDKHLLLVLDNFEQVLAAAPLSADLLAAAPHLKLLVTSRAVLGVYGEHDFLVPSLTLPDPTRLPPLERLTQYEAIRLFIERAQAAQADFTVTNANAPAVAEICHRLDGLPLAIELAAARVRLLPPQGLLARLSSRLKILTGGPRTLPARQQTLRNTIDWSYELLDAGEQLLFGRLAVFVGGRTLAAVEAICNATGDLPLDILDGLQSLLDKSLLQQVESADGEPRFVMLETIWEYALERLMASEEAEALRRRHADYYMALAEQAEPALVGPQQVKWLNRLELEHDNLRAALRWAAECESVEIGLRIGGALWRFWDARGHLSEGRQWLEAALSQRGQAPTLRRARALNGAGNLACNQGDYGRATTLLEESLALSQKLRDRVGIASSLRTLGVVARSHGDYGRARELLEESLALRRELGDKRGIANTLDNLGNVVKNQGDYERATALHEESLSLRRELGDERGIASSLSNLGAVTYDQGDTDQASALHEESLALRQELGDKRGIAYSLNELARVALIRVDYSRAIALHEESLSLFQELGDRRGIALMLNNLGCVAHEQSDYPRAKSLLNESFALFQELEDKSGLALTLGNLGLVTKDLGEFDQALVLYEKALDLYQEQGDKQRIGEVLTGIGGVAGAQGQPERAARLFGAAEVLCETINASLPPSDRANYERNKAIVRAALGEETFMAAWTEGRRMPLEQVIAMARDALLPKQTEPALQPVASAAAPASSSKRDYPASLTARELDVLRLVAQGLTDAQVAERLVVSPRTINAHLSSIYSKLGVTSRTAATRFAVDHHLV